MVFRPHSSSIVSAFVFFQTKDEERETMSSKNLMMMALL
jgi:hypothetical protein